MKKKQILLLGIIIISVFLFPQPIKAETEIEGIVVSDDINVYGLWDKDGFFLGEFTQNPNVYPRPYLEEIDIGYYGTSTPDNCFVEQQAYLKFVDIPIIPNKNITSIRLRMYHLRSDNIDNDDYIENPTLKLTINLVNNNWSETTLNWSNQPNEIRETIEIDISTNIGDNRYLYFDLTYFKDYIENNTISINMVLEKFLLEDYPYWREFEMEFVSKDSGEHDISQRPTLIIEYDDTRPPDSFTLTSNADNPDRDGRFELAWSESEHTDTYSIYQNDTLIESGLTAHTYSVEVFIDRSYDFKVIAFNDYGNMSSNEITVNVEIIIPQPPTPNPFTLTSNSNNPDMDGMFTLYWSKSTHANSYSVYCDDVLLESGLTTLNYIVFYDIGSYTDGNYDLKIVAFNDYGNISSNEITVNIKIPLPPPNPFTITSDADTPDTDGNIMLYWSSSAYTDVYSVYFDNVLLESGITNLYYNVKIYADGSYDFKVVALNDYGQTTSNEITVNVEIPIVQPEPPEPIERDIIPFIVGFSAGIGVLGVTVVVGVVYRIKKVRNLTT